MDEDGRTTAERFRRVLGHFCSGLTVVTGLDEGETVGMVCQSFFSVSLDPPLVALALSKTSTSYPRIRSSGRFCVNLLDEYQEDICQAFATKQQERWRAAPWTTTPQGIPRLADSLAWIECDLDAEHEAGDHVLAIGRVLDLEADEEQRPLLYFQGRYDRLHAPG